MKDIFLRLFKCSTIKGDKTSHKSKSFCLKRNIHIFKMKVILLVFFAFLGATIADGIKGKYGLTDKKT